MECILETKAVTILEFFAGLRGSLAVTFEEGRTCAAWLYDLLKPQVGKLLVCNPRKNALLKAGNKERFASTPASWPNWLRGATRGSSRSTTARPGVRMLRELSRSYLDDRQRPVAGHESLLSRRCIAVGRSLVLGRDVYYNCHRAEWLEEDS